MMRSESGMHSLACDEKPDENEIVDCSYDDDDDDADGKEEEEEEVDALSLCLGILDSDVHEYGGSTRRQSGDGCDASLRVL